MRREVGTNGIVQWPSGRLGGLERRIDRCELVREVETDPAVIGADPPASDPDNVASGAQFVGLKMNLLFPPTPLIFTATERTSNGTPSMTDGSGSLLTVAWAVCGST